MTITISAFKSVPDFAKGHVRDIRVRWALEEAGLRYDEALVDAEIKESADYRAWQPFGQVPAYRDEELNFFESGAIVLHLAERSEALAPGDTAGRARVSAWAFAALNSVEPFVMAVVLADLLYGDADWKDDYRARSMDLMRRRLASLANSLGDKDYLEGRFTAGDILMTTVLRSVEDEELARFPALKAYRARCEARPAFGRALAAQLAAFDREEASAA